jgi:hypothetical protein
MNDGFEGFLAAEEALERGRLSYKDRLKKLTGGSVRQRAIGQGFTMAPEWGGYSDVLNVPGGLEFASAYVKRRLKKNGGEEDWEVWAEAGKEARRQFGLDPFGLKQTSRTVSAKSLQEDRRSAIDEMVERQRRFRGEV